ncbi:CDI toxin immunity protein [Priestia flexa]|uniref:CDI toxin immunity protein n=1 Tax=Priestia flexa TaxID=86664 RepID=UPI00077C4D6E|nr:hypothetical protein [Priestia flexa]MED4587303.1 hypothetical protein [Priestia flexa]
MKPFKKLIEELGNRVDVLTSKQSSIYFEKLVGQFPFTKTNTIDWKRVLIKEKCQQVQQVIQWLQTMKIYEEHVILFSKDYRIPAVRVNLKEALTVVTKLQDCHLFIYCPTIEYVIEWVKDKCFTVGLAAR